MYPISQFAHFNNFFVVRYYTIYCGISRTGGIWRYFKTLTKRKELLNQLQNQIYNKNPGASEIKKKNVKGLVS